MRLQKYEIRVSITKNLYDLISQEAKNRDAKIAAVAREKLAQCFITQEKFIKPAESSNNSSVNQESNFILASLIKTEKRLFSTASRIESLLTLNQEQMDFIITMIDQFYFDLMRFLPHIPKELALAADAMAKQRHSQWLEAIKINMKRIR